MSVDWYLVVSALVFCIGAGGVLTRRNPLVVLLCLELMLNAANLALIGFSRMHAETSRSPVRSTRPSSSRACSRCGTRIERG